MHMIRNFDQAKVYVEGIKSQVPGAEFYWRVEELLSSIGYCDECGEHVFCGSQVELQVQTYPVLKHTPKGVRIEDYQTRAHGKGRFISDETTKQWASPTPEAALKHFIERKKSHLRHLQQKAAVVGAALRIAQGDWEHNFQPQATEK